MTYDVLICFFSVTLTMNRLKCRCTKGLRAPYTGLKAFAAGHLLRLE